MGCASSFFASWSGGGQYGSVAAAEKARLCTATRLRQQRRDTTSLASRLSVCLGSVSSRPVVLSSVSPLSLRGPLFSVVAWSHRCTERCPSRRCFVTAGPSSVRRRKERTKTREKTVKENNRARDSSRRTSHILQYRRTAEQEEQVQKSKTPRTSLSSLYLATPSSLLQLFLFPAISLPDPHHSKCPASSTAVHPKSRPT